MITKLVKLLSLENENVTFVKEENDYYYFTSDEGDFRAYEVTQGYAYDYYNEYQRVWKDCGMFTHDEM